MIALGGIDAETVLDGLRTVGYREPAEDADSGAVWVGGPDLVAGTDPTLTPQLSYLAVLGDEGLVVLSDAERYASRTVAAIRGDEPALDDDPAVTEVALRLGESPVAVAHTGDRGCTVTSLADASEAQGGTWEERFAVESAVTNSADNGSVLLRLRAPERDAQLLSDLGTGGLLFASC